TPVAGGCVEDNGPACSGSAASVAFDGVAGVMYFILAGGYNGQSGTLQIIAARDLTPPVIACPPTIVTNTAPGQCAQVIRFNVTATDNFDPNPTVTCSPASGSTFPRGTTTVYCTATDFSSNSSSCSFVVTVVDAEPPQVICSANIVADADPGQSSKSNVTFTATATDNCPGVTVACNPPSGSTFPVGVTRVTCTAVDASTNLSSCSFTVTVNRDLSPKPITIATVPSGLQVSVDGVTYPAPQVFNWTPGSQHTVSATSPQAGAAGTQYV
ncbi:MAG: HYR domain-containing protein, partial [Verrucomicrobia bacterium]|nr:HYR domain-containing protein [Verrucomicrobiota bacterium]